MSTQPNSLASQPAVDDDPQFVQLAGNIYVAKFFIYLANFTFTGAATLGQSITIDSDADFQLLYLTGTARDGSGNDQSASQSILIQEGSAGGLAWMSAPVNMLNLVGTGQLPFPIGLIPQLLPKKRVYQITVTNALASALTVQLCFVGYKLYPASDAYAVGAGPSSQSGS
jgi:hypothetical protein